jgi:DNA polymerase-3 subunit delta'
VTLADVRGQPSALETLSRAISGGRVHHAYRFEGPEGVGKGMAALGLAQALLCEGGDPMGCGRCDPCQRIATPASESLPVPNHPDVLIVERGLYDNLSEGGKSTGEKQSISIAQIRSVVLERQAFPPVMGRARVFIVRRPEELSTGAANCLLKTLEEPRPDTYFILVTSRPDRLLPTIRSRTIPIRFQTLPDDLVESILTQHGVPKGRIADAVALAEGSASVALELADETRAEARETFVNAMMDASRRGAGAAAALGDGAEKGMLRDQLLALAAHLSRTSRDVAPSDARRAAGLAAAFEETLAAIERVEVSNAAPALTLADLSLKIGRLSAG